MNVGGGSYHLSRYTICSKKIIIITNHVNSRWMESLFFKKGCIFSSKVRFSPGPINHTTFLIRPFSGPHDQSVHINRRPTSSPDSHITRFPFSLPPSNFPPIHRSNLSSVAGGDGFKTPHPRSSSEKKPRQASTTFC